MPNSIFRTNASYCPWAICLGLLAAAIAFNGCVNAMSADPMLEGAQSPLMQGIRGKVIRLSGNLMPSTTDRPLSGSTEFVQTKIWVFSDRIPGNGSPQWPIADAKQHPNLAIQLNSNR